jgi:hypothetical protein
LERNGEEFSWQLKRNGEELPRVLRHHHSFELWPELVGALQNKQLQHLNLKKLETKGRERSLPLGLL